MPIRVCFPYWAVQRVSMIKLSDGVSEFKTVGCTCCPGFPTFRLDLPTGPNLAQLQGVDMFWFKRCPRCSGDLYADYDQYGPYITCAQCGFSKDLAQNGEERIVMTADPSPAPMVLPADDGQRRRGSHGGRHFARTLAMARRSSTQTAA